MPKPLDQSLPNNDQAITCGEGDSNPAVESGIMLAALHQQDSTGIIKSLRSQEQDKDLRRYGLSPASCLLPFDKEPGGLAGQRADGSRQRDAKEKQSPVERADRKQGGGDKHPELSSTANQSQVTDFVAKHRERVDYSRIWPKDVPIIFFGERHTLSSDHDEVIEHLKELKERHGLTHIALEAINQKDQPALDRYMAGKMSREEFAQYVSRFGPEMAEKFLQQIDLAKKLGLKVLALDDNTNNSGTPRSSQDDLAWRIRNDNWARTIDKVLKQHADARVLVFCGSGHSRYTDNHATDISANEILKRQYGRESVVVKFAGGAPGEGERREFIDVGNRTSNAAQQLKVDQERFAVRLNRSELVRDADYVIHLPQIEKDRER